MISESFMNYCRLECSLMGQKESFWLHEHFSAAKALIDRLKPQLMAAPISDRNWPGEVIINFVIKTDNLSVSSSFPVVLSRLSRVHDFTLERHSAVVMC